MKNTKIRCLVDMDGVLCNWDKAFIEVCPEHITARQYEEKFGKDSFWNIINEYGVDWWANLEWMPDGKNLWDFIKSEFPDSHYILSSPSKQYSIEGKTIWCKRELGISDTPCTDLENWDGKTRLIFGKHKHLICKGKNDILIDDTRKKIDAWDKAGGTWVHHKNTEDTITQLMRIRREIGK